jgi:hypothetical protein
MSSGSAPSSSSSSDAQYFYVDDDGATQGPFAAALIAQWRAAGFFDGALRIRHRDETEFQPLAMHPHFNQQANSSSALSGSQSSAMAVEPAPAAPASAASTAASAPAEDGSHTSASSASAAVSITASASDSASAPDPASTASELDFYYIDDDSAIQGPFSAREMGAWLAAGYFRPTTAVRREDEEDFVPIKDRGQNPFQLQPVDSAAESAGQQDIEAAAPTASTSSESHAAALANADSWFYLDSSDCERGPFSVQQMRLWDSTGCWDLETLRFRRGDENQQRTFQQRTEDGAAPVAWLIAPPSRQREDRWDYVDESGQVQGPFTGDEMRAWWRAGMLPASLPVRQLGDEENVFVPIQARVCEFTRAPQPKSPRQARAQQRDTPHPPLQQPPQQQQQPQQTPPPDSSVYPYYPDPAATQAGVQPYAPGYAPYPYAAYPYPYPAAQAAYTPATGYAPYPAPYSYAPYPDPPYPSAAPDAAGGVPQFAAAFSSSGRFRGAAPTPALHAGAEFGGGALGARSGPDQQRHYFDVDAWTEQRNRESGKPAAKRPRPNHHQQQQRRH